MTAALVLALAALVVHPDSLSSSTLVIEGDTATLTMRLQTLSLLEVLPDLDPDNDGVVDPLDVRAAGDAVFAYLIDTYRIATQRGDLDLVPGMLTPHAAGDIGGPLDRSGTTDVGFTATLPADTTGLDVTSMLFADTSPGHLDVLSVTWDGGRPAYAVIGDSRPDASFDRLGPAGSWSTAASFLRLGVHHILTGWDHLAFLAALILGARTWRSLLAVVTMFTLAHSVTLGLSVLGVIDLSGSGGLIEMLIALSIVYIAADTLLHPREVRTRWIEAFGFGLVHGLGFASFLSASLVDASSQAWALVWFNLGVETGQVAAILVAMMVLRLMVGRRDAASANDPGLVPRRLRQVGSAAVLVAGLVWFVQRV